MENQNLNQTKSKGGLIALGVTTAVAALVGVGAFIFKKKKNDSNCEVEQVENNEE